MAARVTQPTDASVTDFLDSVAHPRRRAEGHELRAMCERITGVDAVMWGPSIVGFGQRPDAGGNNWFVIGFSPRTTALRVYGVHDGASEAELDRLGPHTVSPGCLYLKRLDDIDHDALETLIAAAWSRS